MPQREVADIESRRRPGGRSERVRTAVLDAALAQLVAHGYDGLSIGAVAREAGVAETTVYRRWPTSADLAAAAIAHLAQADNPMPDTGTLEGDLRALLAQIAGLLRRPEIERILRTAAAFDSTHPGAIQARTGFWDTRFGGSQVIIERAVERGELDTDIDPHLIIEFLVAPAYLRMLLIDRPLDDEFLETSVRRTLMAFGAVSPR